LKEKISILTLLATHDIYFWGYITEYAALLGIPSLTYLGGFKPTIKTKELIEKRNIHCFPHRLIPENNLFFNPDFDSKTEAKQFIYNHINQRTNIAPIETYKDEERRKTLRAS
jgi:hypothetical protein